MWEFAGFLYKSKWPNQSIASKRIKDGDGDEVKWDVSFEGFRKIENWEGIPRILITWLENMLDAAKISNILQKYWSV